MKGLFAVLFGGPFILAGIFIITVNQSITFSCHRIETEHHPCKLTSSGILGSQTTLIPLESLQRATVEAAISGDGYRLYRDGYRLYRVVLMTNEGAILMMSSADRRYRSKELADKINNFLSNPQERFLLVEEKACEILYLGGGVFILVGIAAAVIVLSPDAKSEN